MPRAMSTLGNFKAILVGMEPCNSSGVHSAGWGVYGLHKQLAAPLQEGVHLGYVTQRGGIYQGGRLEKDGHTGGYLLGYVTRNGLVNGRYSHLHLAIYRGGRYDASYKDGEFTATAGFSEKGCCTLYRNGHKDLDMGQTKLFMEHGRCYIYDGFYPSSRRLPIGYIRTDSDLMQAGACALALLFLSQVEELADKARKPLADWEQRYQNSIVDLSKEMIRLQQIEDMLAYAGQQRNPLQTQDLDINALRQQKTACQERISKLQLHFLQTTVSASSAVAQARAMFEMWREDYKNDGGYCGICKDHATLQ